MVLKEQRGGACQCEEATVPRHHDIQSSASAKTAAEVSSTRVRFAEEKNAYFEAPAVDDIELRERWYAHVEIKEMKMEKSVLAKDIIVADQQSTSRVTFQTVLMKAFHDCCNFDDAVIAGGVSPEGFKRLVRLLELCPSRIGMETVAVPVVSIRQHIHRSELKRSLKSIQKHRKDMDPRKMEECIRQACESYSRPSRLYASYIAQAHAEGGN
jgi:hypothetical protein